MSDVCGLRYAPAVMEQIFAGLGGDWDEPLWGWVVTGTNLFSWQLAAG